MIDKIIVFIDPNDNMTKVIHPAPEMFDINSRTRQYLISQGFEFENDDSLIKYILDKSLPEHIGDYSIVDRSIMPSTRVFRDAWTFNHDTKTFDHDISKAQAIHMDRLRDLRHPKLTALDVEFMRSQEEGNSAKAAEIIAKKQALREISSLTLPDNVEELANFIPDVLKD